MIWSKEPMTHPTTIKLGFEVSTPGEALGLDALEA